MTYKAIRYTVYCPALNITDTSGIGKRCKSEWCRKMRDACVICEAEGN